MQFIVLAKHFKAYTSLLLRVFKPIRLILKQINCLSYSQILFYFVLLEHRRYLQENNIEDSRWSIVTRAIAVCINNPQNGNNEDNVAYCMNSFQRNFRAHF